MASSECVYTHSKKPSWDYIPNPEKPKPPSLVVGRFFGGALLQALIFIPRDGCNGCDG